MRFACLFSGGFTTLPEINPPEKKLENRASVAAAFYFAKSRLDRCLAGLTHYGALVILIYTTKISGDKSPPSPYVPPALKGSQHGSSNIGP